MNETKLDFYIKNNLNVIFVGKHGTGKTSVVKDAFDRNGLKWKYFSASTMDPWVDFVGVPRTQTDPETGKEYLGLVRPREFVNDEIEALFFDEFNRSNKKVRNAVMELLQFKSINGHAFNNLRIVWAAINPDDDDDASYDVEKVDPAQLDRFQICVNVNYAPSARYFTKKFGQETSEAACAWWSGLPDNMKNLISPRRLDYALDVFNFGGDMRDVLPAKTNVSKLLDNLSRGSIKKRLEEVMSLDDDEKTSEWLHDGRNFTDCIETICKNDKFLDYFVPHMTNEQFTIFIANNNKKVWDFVRANQEKYKKQIQAVMETSGSKKLINRIKKELPYIKDTKVLRINPWKNGKNKSNGWSKKFVFNKINNTYDRIKLYEQIKSHCCKNMDKDDVLFAIETLGKEVFARSQKSTITKLSNWKGVIRHLLDELNRIDGCQDCDLENNYKEVKDTMLILRNKEVI